MYRKGNPNKAHSHRPHLHLLLLHGLLAIIPQDIIHWLRDYWLMTLSTLAVDTLYGRHTFKTCVLICVHRWFVFSCLLGVWIRTVLKHFLQYYFGGTTANLPYWTLVNALRKSHRTYVTTEIYGLICYLNRQWYRLSFCGMPVSRNDSISKIYIYIYILVLLSFLMSHAIISTLRWLAYSMKFPVRRKRQVFSSSFYYTGCLP